MKDRIKQIMEQHKMLQQDFAKHIGISASTLSGIFTGKTQPSTKIFQAIHAAFPDISTDWLLFGEGEMFTSEEAAFRAMLAEEEAEQRQLKGEKKEAGEKESFAKVVSPAPTTSAHVVPSATHPSLFDATPTPPIPAVEMVKFVSQAQRSIKEIRVFYDDGTYEDFLPGSR